MAIVVTNAQISIGGVDLSSHVTKVTLSTTRAEIETTTFGNTAKRRVAGLADSSVAIDFNQDFAGAASVESTLYPLLGSTAQIIVKPNGTATGTANPSYTFSALVTEWMPLDAQVGELASASITWPIDGTIAKATA
jgi:hypothetical protein